MYGGRLWNGLHAGLATTARRFWQLATGNWQLSQESRPLHNSLKTRCRDLVAGKFFRSATYDHDDVVTLLQLGIQPPEHFTNQPFRTVPLDRLADLLPRYHREPILYRFALIRQHARDQR